MGDDAAAAICGQHLALFTAFFRIAPHVKLAPHTGLVEIRAINFFAPSWRDGTHA